VDTHETPPIGRRLCVLGTSGSGKSYVAIEAARRLGLRYVSNDALIWGADWRSTPREDRPAIFDAATRDDDG
jgi:adenylate kinase family enzyme